MSEQTALFVIIGIAVVLLLVFLIPWGKSSCECYNSNKKASNGNAKMTSAPKKPESKKPESKKPQPKREKWAPFMTSNADPKAIVPIQNLRASWTGPTSNPFVGGWNGQLSGGLSSIKSTVMETTGAENSSESMMFKTVI